jgi:CDP-diacylglycerol--glycerol-3-phosphate 3-phosphatidyltransferase
VAANRDARSEWSQLHDGYDVDRSRLVRAWLGAMDAIAAPLARSGVPPTALTVTGVLSASAALVTAPRVASLLVLTSATCDGLDGAVARRTGSAGRPRAALVDHAADRVTDVLFAAALRHAGAPAWAAATAGIAAITYESARSITRRRRPRVPFIAAGERPMRVAAVVAGIAVAPGGGAIAVTVMSVVSCVQLAVATCSRTGRDD